MSFRLKQNAVLLLGVPEKKTPNTVAEYTTVKSRWALVLGLYPRMGVTAQPACKPRSYWSHNEYRNMALNCLQKSLITCTGWFDFALLFHFSLEWKKKVMWWEGGQKTVKKTVRESSDVSFAKGLK